MSRFLAGPTRSPSRCLMLIGLADVDHETGAFLESFSRSTSRTRREILFEHTIFLSEPAHQVSEIDTRPSDIKCIQELILSQN